MCLNAAFAAGGVAASAVTPGGAIAGAAIGTAIAMGAGLTAWSLLVLMFGLVVAVTKASARRRSPGMSRRHGERRGAGNALANAGLAAVGAAIFFVSGWWAARIGLVAALIASGSDSIASEAGQGWGRTTWHVRRGQVPAGTTGGISVVGTLAGIGAVVSLTAYATAVHLLTSREAVGVAIGAMVAFLFEGMFISRLEDEGLLDNNEVNLLGSLVSALMAVAWVYVFR